MNYAMKKSLRSLGLAAAFSMLGTAAFAGVLKHPYLIYPGANSQMEVLWQDDASEATNTLSWGTDTTYSLGSATVPEYGAYNQHMYTIAGLSPDTKYYYQVANQNTDGTVTVYGTGSFITGPADSATSVRFLGMGDSRTNPAGVDSVMQAMQTFYSQPGNAEYQRMVIHNGDWVSNDNDASWVGQWFGPATINGVPNIRLTDVISFTANSPINGCKGNHDNITSYPNGTTTYFTKYFPFPYQHATHSGIPVTFDPATVQTYGSLYWSYDYGPVHFTIVDNYSNLASGSDQYNWVVSDLAATTKPWKILIYHEPAYSAGSDGDNSNVRVLEPLITQFGVDLVYCGHSHNYARAGAYTASQANGDTIALNVPHITNGGGGAPVYQPDFTNNASYPHVITAWPAFEFMTFDVQDKKLTMTAYQVNNVKTTAMPSGLSLSPIETIVLNHFTDKSSQVSATTGNLAYNRATKLYTGNLTITNNGPALTGNIDVVLDGILNLPGIGNADNQYSTTTPKAASKIAIKPATGKGSTDPGLMTTVTLTNATGSNNGEPMIQASTSGLAAGASITVPLSFSNPTGAKITFNPITYQE